MNFNFYIFGKPHNFEIYPKDKFLSLFQGFDDDSVETSKLVVTRREQVVYYSYLHYGLLQTNKKEKAFLGITLTFNGVFCTDVNKLYELFDHVFQSIIERGVIVSGSDKSKLGFSITAFNDISDEIAQIKEQISKAINRHFQLDFQELDNSFKWGAILEEPRKYSLYEGNNVLTAVLKEHTNIAISTEYEIRKKSLFSKSNIFKWVALFACVLLIGWLSYRFIPKQTIVQNNTDTIMVVKTKKQLSSSIKPKEGKRVASILFTPEYINFYIIRIDSVKNWETLLIKEKYSRDTKQVDLSAPNSREEKKKAILNQILREITDKKEIDNYYFIADKRYRNDEDINEYARMIHEKGYSIEYFNGKELVNDRHIPVAIQYVMGD